MRARAGALGGSFRASARFHLEELMFVRENGDCWQDVALLPLGHGQLSSKS